MQALTKKLWAKQNQHGGDRRRLFSALAEYVGARHVLYPGSYVDIAASFVWESVTYVDMDKRAARFFADQTGVSEIITASEPATADPEFAFIAADYTTDLGLEDESFDLLLSLYAGFISEHCTRYLRIGGSLLVNASHGDVAMASIDPRYQLTGVITSRAGCYHVDTRALDDYLVPKKPIEVTAELLHELGRAIAYTKQPFAYLFTRLS